MLPVREAGHTEEEHLTEREANKARVGQVLLWELFARVRGAWYIMRLARGRFSTEYHL